MRPFVVAVDVGTGSARAGVFDRAGALLARSEHPILMKTGDRCHACHDSEDIWRAISQCVRAAAAKAGVAPDQVAAIGFDATCSLVVRDRAGEQLSVSIDGDPHLDTIVWLDHRAVGEAEECTASGHAVLRFLGGAMSPEMQTPKLMWLKRNLPGQWAKAGHFFDLADFLTWRASGSTERSQCTLTAKWTYLAHEAGWHREFFAGIGLDDMFERGGLPDRPVATGAAVGRLTPRAAAELGLDTHCRVASGLIDAFAGAVGTIGGADPDTIERRAALIAGTSNCVMGLTRAPLPARGVWGPYFGATLPGLWHWEGGQSATGALLDHIVRLFGQGRDPDRAAHDAIAGRILQLREVEGAGFAGDIHVMPDFHGNRTPFADPRAKGAIFGLTLDASFDALCRVYWRTAVGIALGLRHILDHLSDNGYAIDTLHMAGGHSRNPILRELYPDVTRRTVVQADTEDSVLLGTAMAAAVGAGWHDSFAVAAKAMSAAASQALTPSKEDRHVDDYRMLKDFYRSSFARANRRD